MKKILLLLLLVPVFIFICIFGLLQQIGNIFANEDSQTTVVKACKYDWQTKFEDEETEKMRNTAEQYLIDKKYVNAVLGIYSMDKKQDVAEIGKKINKLIEYATEKKMDYDVMTYIQAYKFTADYFDYLRNNNMEHSVATAKTYQELDRNKDKFKENDYQFAQLALVSISDDCQMGQGGLPLDKNTYSVTSGFPYRSDGTFHAGLDLGVKYGSRTYAIEDGEVMIAGTGCPPDGGYIGNQCGMDDMYGAGNYVLYKVQKGMDTIYILQCHLSEVRVKKGEKITQGQLIGLSGNSGNSSGAHLHLEIHKNVVAIGADKNLVNPCEYIKGLCEVKNEE